jgi:hypothetical protein
MLTSHLLPAQDVNATNADDDTAGFTLSATTLSTTEAGGVDTFTVVLDAQPSANVVFTVTSNDTSEGTPDVSTLTFTPANWNTPQTITVTGADDTLIDGDIPYVVQVAVDTVNTLDVNFAALPAQDVNAINADDDTAGFTLNTTTLSTTEAGGTDTVTVVLGCPTKQRCGAHHLQQRHQRRYARCVYADIHAHYQLGHTANHHGHYQPKMSTAQTTRSLMAIFLTSCK